jgi:hypothetical protein
MLVLGLNADKQLGYETPGAELVSCNRREERVLPIERSARNRGQLAARRPSDIAHTHPRRGAGNQAHGVLSCLARSPRPHSR